MWICVSLAAYPVFPMFLPTFPEMVLMQPLGSSGENGDKACALGVQGGFLHCPETDELFFQRTFIFGY